MTAVKDPDERMRGFLRRQPRPRRPSVKRKKVSPLTQAIADAETAATSGDWSAATGATLVGLYAYCHREVYGVAPLELDQQAALRAAAKHALDFVVTHFEADFDAAVEFVKWSWMREKGREQWAAREGKERGRMGWRLQFSTRLLTDYRVDMSRRRRRR